MDPQSPSSFWRNLGSAGNAFPPPTTAKELRRIAHQSGPAWDDFLNDPDPDKLYPATPPTPTEMDAAPGPAPAAPAVDAGGPAMNTRGGEKRSREAGTIQEAVARRARKLEARSLAGRKPATFAPAVVPTVAARSPVFTPGSPVYSDSAPPAPVHYGPTRNAFQPINVPYLPVPVQANNAPAAARAAGRMQTQARAAVPDRGVDRSATRLPCARCAKEYGRFPDLVCVKEVDGNGKCTDCNKKHKECEPVSPPAPPAVSQG